MRDGRYDGVRRGAVPSHPVSETMTIHLYPQDEPFWRTTC
jgi:hypothetical protein